MNGYQMRQGTVYTRKTDHTRLLLVHHNPMNLESLVLTSPGENAPFDTAHPAVISLETLIALRHSGEYQENGDLPGAELKPLLAKLLTDGGLTEEAAALVENVQKELPE